METNKSIYEYFRDSCKDENATKIIYYGRKLSHGKLCHDITMLSGFMQHLGIKKGDVISIMLPNIPQAVISLYAINNVGGVANLIHPKISTTALVKILTSTHTKLIFLYDALYKTHNQALQKLGIKVISCSVSTYMQGIKKWVLKLMEYGRGGRALRYADISKEYKYIPVTVMGNDRAVYIHSGGTTGESKTVVHSNLSLNTLSESIINSVYQYGESYKSSDSMLMMLPIFHGFGLGVSTHTILSHIHMIMMPRFVAGSANRLIKRYKITHLAGVPAMYKKMMNHSSFKGDFSSISHIFCGGDSLPFALKSEFDNKIQSLGSTAEILEGYGLTETASVFSLCLNGSVRKHSQGTPLIGNKIRVVDENFDDVAIGQCGEFLLSSPSLMTEYLENGTSDVIMVDKNGERWLKTGDIGIVDGDGYIYFKERAKRTIKISAINIFPSEIEQVVCGMDEIKECCVARYTINNKPYTKLYIVLNKNYQHSPAMENKINKTISQNIIKYAVPKEIVVTDAIYRTSLGKVDYARYEREINKI